MKKYDWEPKNDAKLLQKVCWVKMLITHTPLKRSGNGKY